MKTKIAIIEIFLLLVCAPLFSETPRPRPVGEKLSVRILKMNLEDTIRYIEHYILLNPVDSRGIGNRERDRATMLAFAFLHGNLEDRERALSTLVEIQKERNAAYWKIFHKKSTGTESYSELRKSSQQLLELENQSRFASEFIRTWKGTLGRSNQNHTIQNGPPEITHSPDTRVPAQRYGDHQPDSH